MEIAPESGAGTSEGAWRKPAARSSFGTKSEKNMEIAPESGAGTSEGVLDFHER
jgi:hypothetical protein